MKNKTSSLVVLFWIIAHYYCPLLFAAAQSTNPVEGDLLTVALEIIHIS